MKQNATKTIVKSVDMEKVKAVQELLPIAKSGDSAAFIRLAELLKVRQIAVGFTAQCRGSSSSLLETADLEQDLMLCLLNCIRRYDVQSTIPFYAYARRSLKNECAKSKRKSYTISYTLYGAMKVAGEIARANPESGYEDNTPIVCGTPSFIRVESFPSCFDEDGNEVPMEFESDELTFVDSIERDILFGEIRKMVKYIDDEVERQVIQMKYGFPPYKRPHAAAEIAKKIENINERLVYTIIRRVLCRLVAEHCDLLMSA